MGGGKEEKKGGKKIREEERKWNEMRFLSFLCCVVVRSVHLIYGFRDRFRYLVFEVGFGRLILRFGFERSILVNERRDPIRSRNPFSSFRFSSRVSISRFLFLRVVCVLFFLRRKRDEG